MCEMRVCTVIEDIASRYKVRNVKIISYGEILFEGNYKYAMLFAGKGLKCYKYVYYVDRKKELIINV